MIESVSLVFTCVVNFLCDVNAFSVSESSIDWGSSGWGQGGVESIDIKAQVYRPLFPVQEQATS